MFEIFRNYQQHKVKKVDISVKYFFPFISISLLLNLLIDSYVCIRAFQKKIKFYTLRQNLHQTCFNDSGNDPSPKCEIA